VSGTEKNFFFKGGRKTSFQKRGNRDNVKGGLKTPSRNQAFSEGNRESSNGWAPLGKTEPEACRL